MVKRLCCLGGSVLLPLAVLMIWGHQAQVVNTVLAGNPNPLTRSAEILVDAVLYDGYELNDADEAVALRNIGQTAVSLEGWRISDGRLNDSELPPDLIIEPGDVIWIAGIAEAFQRQFGFAADAILAPWPGFANDGDKVILYDSSDQVIDVLVYGNEGTNSDDWLGPEVQPYTVKGLFGKENQVLYRKIEQVSGLPVLDTNSAGDWAQDRSDPINGRKVRYPGWSLEGFFVTGQVTETAVLTVSIAPDNAFETVVEAIAGSVDTVFLESLTFENLVIGNALVDAASRGVEVKVLLEGSPPGGLAAQEKFICRQLEMSGGQCWFMISDADQRIYDRYRYLHSKFILVDSRLVAISSENLSPNSMPYDDKTDGTWGRRGVVLLTDAVGVVGQVRRLFEDDLDPLNHEDVFRWQTDHPVYGAPPVGFTPVSESGGITYSVRYPQATVYRGDFFFELQHAPENSLRDEDGILGLVNRAGFGDAVWAQQLVERPFWGASGSNRVDDPNPRLEAYIAAARRGADVRLLLDEYFDDADSPVSNHATCLLLNRVAADENLSLACSLGNPTGLGIHNKMVLVHVAGQGYIYVGSINGSELSNKGNRELALLVQSDDAYTLLADMFVRDIVHTRKFPLILGDYRGSANHMLISEVLYDSYGPDEIEFIELVNPTAAAIDIGGYGLADAVNREDFEDLRRFPSGTIVAAGDVLLTVTSADSFWNEYGYWPDFEILETAPTIPNLIDDPSWGDPETFLRLGNSGDEVILRDGDDEIVDLVTYGAGAYLGQVACSLLTGTNHSLERFPYWHDSDICLNDFRDWPFPSPGRKP